MDGLILTALNAVSRYSGKAAMDTTLTANVYPGRSTHFGRTSTALTVGDRTYTIPNAAQSQSRNISNASRIIGVGAQAGSETLQMSADSYGWQHAVLSGDQYADAVRKQFDTVRVALAKITPNGPDTEIQSITPIGGGFTPDDLAAGYDATTWSNTYIESKTLADTMKLATLTAADMQSADTVAAKLPEHQAAVVHDGRDWYVAVNFGKLSDDTKLPASQSGYGDKATQDLYDNVRAANLPYPSMTANFTVTFNDPAKQQTAKIARSHNTAWGQGLPAAVETKVYDQGWDLGTQPVSAEGSGSAAEAVTGTFDTNGGTAVDSQKIKVGDTLAEPYTQRDGFTFDGWYLNGVRYDFATPVAKDITLKAAWRSTTPVRSDNDGRASKTITKAGDGVYTETLKATLQKGMGNPSIHETLSTDVTAPGRDRIQGVLHRPDPHRRRRIPDDPGRRLHHHRVLHAGTERRGEERVHAPGRRRIRRDRRQGHRHDLGGKEGIRHRHRNARLGRGRHDRRRPGHDPDRHRAAQGRRPGRRQSARRRHRTARHRLLAGDRAHPRRGRPRPRRGLRHRHPQAPPRRARLTRPKRRKNSATKLDFSQFDRHLAGLTRKMTNLGMLDRCHIRERRGDDGASR